MNSNSPSQSSNELAWSLFDQFPGNDKKNVFVSPLSISIALNIAYQGSQGAVRKKAFGLIHEQTEKELFLIQELLDDKSVEFNSANGVWTASNVSDMNPPEPSYAKLILERYRAPIHHVSFSPAASIETSINSWVSEKTNAMIKKLVSMKDIESSSMVVVNAVYFKGKWARPFLEERTTSEDFHGSLRKSSIPFMDQTDHFAYHKARDFQSVSLSYRGQRIELVVLLPNSGVSLHDLSASLKASEVEAEIKQAKVERVHIELPKFELEWGGEDLMPLLKSMGMPTRGDFTPMGCKDLELKKVIHKTALKMNEQGSEAAAATAVIGAPGSAMPSAEAPPIEFKIDRPFVFVIRQPKSGQWIFIGKIENL